MHHTQVIRDPRRRAAFTLVEMLVVLVILMVLGALALGGLSNASRSSRTQTTVFLIRRLSDAILERYEEYEDAALKIKVPPLAVKSEAEDDLQELRQRIRNEMPDSWADVADFGTPHPVSRALNIPAISGSSSAVVRSYARYKQARPGASDSHQSAECLYMIVTQSGLFPDFLENIRPERVGDVDGDDANEFVDGWGNPIAFIRWAPGFSSPYSPIQIADAASNHDPLDLPGTEAIGDALDPTAFALYPLIYSPGPDGDYGLLEAKTGWPYAKLATTSGNSPCTYNPDGAGLVGAPNPASDKARDFLDNVTNHHIMAK